MKINKFLINNFLIAKSLEWKKKLINNLLIAKSLEYSETSSYYKQNLLSLILNWKIITNR